MQLHNAYIFHVITYAVTIYCTVYTQDYMVIGWIHAWPVFTV